MPVTDVARHGRWLQPDDPLVLILYRWGADTADSSRVDVVAVGVENRHCCHRDAYISTRWTGIACGGSDGAILIRSILH